MEKFKFNHHISKLLLLLSEVNRSSCVRIANFFQIIYVLNYFRNNDYENFLPTLLVKGPDKRQCIFAVRAFNIEVAKIAGVVSSNFIEFTVNDKQFSSLVYYICLACNRFPIIELPK